MTERIFSYHIFWKEYRQMRGFWLSILVMTAVLQLIVLASTLDSPARGDAPYSLAVCFAALYALGCGATMFALEHENGTYDFLRALPTRALPTLLGKIAFTIISTPILLLAMLAFAALFDTLMGQAVRIEPATLFVWLIGSLLLFVWATFFSLLTNHAVRAALFGGVAAVFSVVGPAAALDGIGVPSHIAVAVALVVVLTSVTAVDVWLGMRWYREATATSNSDDFRRRREEFAKSYGAYELEAVASQGSTFAHLLWLQWRQSRGMILALTTLVVWFVCAMVWIGGFEESVRRSYAGIPLLRIMHNLASAFSVCGIFAGCAVLPAAGASVFAGDQKRSQFRFLADRGLSPKLVWWSRHPVWIAAAMIWIALTIVPILIFIASHAASHGPDTKALIHDLLWAGFPTFLCLLLAYSFGQFCSMLVRAGILCVAIALIGSILLALWTFTMAILQVPLIWSVAPIPVLLLFATRIRTRGWLIESNSFKSWLPVALILLVPSAAILSGTALYRAYSLPFVEPGFDVAAFTAPASPEAVKTAETYRRASDALLAGTSVIDYRDTEDQNPDQDSVSPVALILDASKQNDCDDLSKYFSPNTLVKRTQDLTGAVLEAGSRLENEGDLDGAIEHYLAVLHMANQFYPRSDMTLVIANIETKALFRLSNWSTQPGQTKERIVEAIREIEELTSQPPAMDTAIKSAYVRFLGVIDGDIHDMFGASGPQSRKTGAASSIYWMPWERERARRTLRLAVFNELHTYRRIQKTLADSKPVTVPDPKTPPRITGWLQLAPDAWLREISFANHIRQLATTELIRRATLIKMALVAWQLDHDSLPDELSQLQSEYLTKVPADPFSGDPFGYFPNGAKERIVRYEQHTNKETTVIEAKKPFFASRGPSVIIRDGGAGLNRFEILQDHKTRSPTSWQDLLAAEWVFPIPQPR